MDSNAPHPFHGSYRAQDVQFLLKQVTLAPTDIQTKERLIQSGQAHYSTMLSAEHPPSPAYLAFFYQALERNEDRFARDLATLAKTLAAKAGKEIVIASLARAGTPVGVLLLRALRSLKVKATHYSISIIRDRGIDTAALDFILSRHAARDVIFLDGWTGKGAIATELKASVAKYNASRNLTLSTDLSVVVDLAGVAPVAVTADDYLIPSSILNAVVSGLISRTILNDECVGPGDFHACVYYSHLAGHDFSTQFVDRLSPQIEEHLPLASAVEWPPERRAELNSVSEAFLAEVSNKFGVLDRNRIKPGIGESTRALLRRVPERLLVADPFAQDMLHLQLLAEEKNVAVHHIPHLPYRAAVIIRTLGGDF